MFLFLLTACAPKTPPAPEHLAILRFENLSADASADWMGRAFSEIITAELAGLPDNFAIPVARLHAVNRSLGVRPASAPGISTERSAAVLAGANRIGYGDYTVRGGRVEARLTIQDAQTGRTTQVLAATAGDVIGAATTLARSLSPRAEPYQTANSQAAQSYATALEAGSAPARAEAAQAAIAADPNFAPPYLLLAETKAQQQDRDGALAALDQGLARGNAIPAGERARLQLMAAGLRNDAAARQAALTELAKATPADGETWHMLAETAFTRHDYPQAVEAYQKASQLEPDAANLLNQLAYAQAFSGNRDAALATVRRYQTLKPAEANPLDTLGDIQLIYGHLREAEDFYLQADKKDRKLLQAGDLLKAAMARLMSGDTAGATDLDKQFLAARTEMHDPAVPVLAAEWAWISGNRQAGEQQLRAFAQSAETGPLQELASHAYTELAMWSLQAGDRAAAAQAAFKASTLAKSQGTATEAAVARFLAQPSATPAEWSQRADQVFRNAPQLKTMTLAFALLFDHRFAAAAPLLRQVYDSSDPDPGLPVLLAWSLKESGHADQAAPLLRFNPVPNYSGLGQYTPFWFPRLAELRK